jgi:hypothetical protein
MSTETPPQDTGLYDFHSLSIISSYDPNLIRNLQLATQSRYFHAIILHACLVSRLTIMKWTVKMFEANLELITAFSRDITQRIVAIPYGRFETIYRSHLQGPRTLDWCGYNVYYSYSNHECECYGVVMKEY